MGTRSQINTLFNEYVTLMPTNPNTIFRSFNLYPTRHSSFSSLSMDSSQLHHSKMENPHDFDWFCIEEAFEEILPPLDSFFDYKMPPLLPSQNLQFNDYMGFRQNGDFLMENYFNYNNLDLPFLYEDAVFESEPQRVCYSQVSTENSSTVNNNHDQVIKRKGRMSSGRKKSEMLEMEEIQKYFDVPITRAAKLMNVGLTVLKKRCRELNIQRWPHRKIKSLKTLINNVKDLGLTNEVTFLEEHKRLVEELPDLELTDGTKRLRQACFKANYKKRRFLEAAHQS